MTTKTPNRIHLACLRNLNRLLRGELTFEGWRRRQEELESRLSPEPELPFSEGPTEEPKRPQAA